MSQKLKTYDLTIIGGGPAGYTAALQGVDKGFKVALIEKERMGGTCLNHGCVPTQCLLRDLNEYSFLISSEFIEVDRSQLRISFGKVMERKNRVVDQLVKATESTLSGKGVDIFRGEAVFKDNNTVRIISSQIDLKSKFIIIATGAYYQSMLSLEFDHQNILDTTDALNMTSVPKSIAIIGQGHRAITFADIFQCLGSRVYLVAQSRRILPDEDREIASRYRRVLKEKGIQLVTNANVMHVESGTKEGGLDLHLKDKKGSHLLQVEKVLVTGKRKANTQGLNLDNIGVKQKQGLISVDKNLMTSIPNIYAIGDAVGGKYTAHKAMKEGLTVVRRLAGEAAEINYELIPICYYTNPEIASIGLTEEEARKEREDIEVGYFLFPAGTRPMIFGYTQGIHKFSMIKVVFEKKYGELIGVHIIGPQATELISLASMAMKNELSLYEISEVVYAHPTFSENFFEAINDAVRK